MKQIKPCPFCGSENLSVGSFENYIKCKNCGAAGPDGSTLNEAFDKWNAAPRKEDDHMGGSCLNCKFYPCSNKTPGTFWCSNWEEKEDTKMEKSCRNCKYLKLGNKAKSKWYCTKALEDEYSSCKSWAPYNPFKPTQMTVCSECQYEYWDNGEHYCGKAIGNLDYCCTDWAEKESKSTPLNTENSSGLKPFIPEAKDELKYIQRKESTHNQIQQLAEEAAELAQAALKFNRVMGCGCYTPVNPKDARDAVIEELADVLLCLEAAFPHYLGNMNFYSNLARVYREKAERWAERLKEAKDE